MIHATRIAFSVGIISMSIATLIGVLLGSLSGFFGDTRLRMSRIRFIVFVSVPRLFLIISIVAIIRNPSLAVVMIIIGLTSWMGIARLIRGELLRVRSLEYIEAATALGFSDNRALLKHAIPNALSPVLIAIAFGIAGAILTEAFLSFIGIGVPAETVTWGSLLNVARSYTGLWWLAVFPGFAIFLTITFFNLIGEGLTDALDPKLKK
ncbi:UNVERIFIED_CONTAM: hypothetical protein GTU68_028825 [Idotea baltica]|nr:hypothetical protein [Idotea baltica]